MKIQINQARVDYWTFTTFDKWIFEAWHYKMREEGAQHEKRKRYEGDRGKGRFASVFVGVGTQKGREHYIVECSGESSHGLMSHFVNTDMMLGRVNCTRIDVQVTIDEPLTWSQLAYEKQAEDHGLKPTKARSNDTVNGGGLELITVYTGTRESGRFNRVYEKVMQGGERLLRFETQYGRGYSKAVAASILSGKQTCESVIRGEIARRNLPLLDWFDLWSCSTYSPKQEKRVEHDNRAMWLVTDILPVFAEYIQRHDADPHVAAMFASVIHRSSEHSGYENLHE